MKNIEFYITPTGGVMIHDESGVRLLKENDRKFISIMIEKINEFYPEALQKLSQVYESKRPNIPHYEYCIASRFIRCNWGRFDNTMDIDQFGNLNFEEVECPLRGECPCEDIVCRPKFNSKLSEREIEVMHLYYNGKHAEEIADQLCLSIHTVRTHKRNAFNRTETNSISQFMAYANKNNLFNI